MKKVYFGETGVNITTTVPEGGSKMDYDRAQEFFAAAAPKLIDGDSTVLEYCEGDFDKAAKFLGISLEGK